MRDHKSTRAWLIACFAISTCVAQDEVPSVQSFIRRGSSRASIIGDYVYFDGGEIAQDGYDEFRMNNQVNSTLSIDLTQSWTPRDVKLREISKPEDTIRMTKQAIFTDESSGTFYTWGGHTSWHASIGNPVMMRFKPDGEGSGSWTTDRISDTLSNAERVESGAYVSTGDAGFVFGGFSGELTSKEPKGDVIGYATFNFTTKEWTSDAEAPYSSGGTLFGATATFAPDFGPNGVITLLGGMTEHSSSNPKYADFRTVYLLDPVTREWFSQTTTGSAPSGRHYHCATGVASTNGTFEIFVFGGTNEATLTDYSDMYILSLPGFRWTKVNGLNNEARAEHVCVVIGKRQLLSWGGNNGNREEGRWEGKDTFPQGIGILDMSSLEWKDKYDASAKDYESHSSVSDWYKDGGLDSVDWSSDQVREMFVPKKEEQGNGGSGNNEGSDNGNGGGNGDNSNGEDQSKTEESSKTPVGAIAGGVVGGVALLLALGFAIWFFRRRKRQQAEQQGQAEAMANTNMYKDGHPVVYQAGQPGYYGSGPGMYSQAPGAPVSELEHKYPAAELRGDDQPVELGDNEVRYNR